MTEDLRLRDDLAALSAQVRPAALDLPALQAVARHRVRRRRLLVAGPVVLALLGAAMLLPPLGRAPQDRLTTATAPSDGPLRLSMTATVRAPAVAGLSVRVEPGTLVTDEGTRFELTWTLAAGSVALPLSDQPFARQVRADAGPGVVGVTDGRCGYWDGQGRRTEHSCPALPPAEEQPGTSRTTSLLIANVVEDGSIADGTYRFPVPAGSLATADVVLTVAGSHAQGGRPVPVSGQVLADHGRGPVLVGRGPVRASLSFRATRNGRTSDVVTGDGSWSARLVPGSYRVTVTVADGSCPEQDLVVRAGQPATLDTTCEDGSSTF